MENIQKAKNAGHQSQDRPEQLNTIDNVIYIDDVLNAIAKVECSKSSQQSTPRTSVEDYCSFVEELDLKAFLNDWSCKA